MTQSYVSGFYVRPMTIEERKKEAFLNGNPVEIERMNKILSFQGKNTYRKRKGLSFPSFRDKYPVKTAKAEKQKRKKRRR